MNPEEHEPISDALERLALSIGASGAVPVPELVRALERAAERLRMRGGSAELPHDLVSQAEAARAIGISRQAVNQWVRNGVVRPYVGTSGPGRHGPQVSLSEVAVAANRRPRDIPFSPLRRRELLQFLAAVETGSTAALAAGIRDCLDEEAGDTETGEPSRVLREFVIAAMALGDRRQEFTAEGVTLLAELSPTFAVDLDSPFGVLAASLDLLVRSSDGSAGFDSPATAMLGLIGVATVGAEYPGADADVGRQVAAAADQVWGAEWPSRLYDATLHIGELRPVPLTRYTASLTYLDHNRFLRQAQASGLTVGYARGPGPLLPQRFHGAHVLSDLLAGRPLTGPPWAWSDDGSPRLRPAQMSSTESPFRIFNYDYGLLDRSIHGIRRYCYSAVDARTELRGYLQRLPTGDRTAYVDIAVRNLARTLRQPAVELGAVTRKGDFDWWKDHVIRASEREILIGLRDERARRVAHALLVQTSMLPEVVQAADGDASLRDRLRIYVKNLEFDVVEARYQDDVRREVTRVVKEGGRSLSSDEAHELAEAEIHTMLG